MKKDKFLLYLREFGSAIIAGIFWLAVGILFIIVSH